MKASKPHTITVANLKGGVGKTTTAVCAAAGLAGKGRGTILIDLDSQDTATAHLLDLSEIEGSATVFDVLEGKMDLSKAAFPTHVEGLRVVAPGGDKDRYERYARKSGDSELALRKAAGSPGSEDVDYIVIDTPPSLDFFSVSAIAASDWVIVPVTCEYLPLLGLKQFNERLSRIRERLGFGPDILGYLMTMVDRRERITWEVEEVLRKTFGSRLFRTHIRIDTKVKVCPSHKMTIFEYEPENGRARSDYESLVEEIIERVESPHGR